MKLSGIIKPKDLMCFLKPLVKKKIPPFGPVMKFVLLELT